MKRTGLILLVVAFGLATYDFYTGFAAGSETTISWVIYSMSREYPSLPFGAGYLMGHLFASMRGIPYQPVDLGGKEQEGA